MEGFTGSLQVDTSPHVSRSSEVSKVVSTQNFLEMWQQLNLAIDITANDDVEVLLGSQLFDDALKQVIGATGKVLIATKCSSCPTIDAKNDRMAVLPDVTAIHANPAIARLLAGHARKLGGLRGHGKAPIRVFCHSSYSSGRFRELRIEARKHWSAPVAVDSMLSEGSSAFSSNGGLGEEKGMRLKLSDVLGMGASMRNIAE